jgi:hypothetical protein
MTKSNGDAFVVSVAAYTANDCVGGLAKVFYGTGGGLLLRGISIRDNAVQNEPYIVHIFRSTPSTTIADADAMALVSADGDLEVGQVTINAGDYVTVNGGDYSKAYKSISDIEIDEVSKGAFYVYLECTATPDYVATDDIKVEFVYWID